jgi:hypothetical protein
LLPASLAFIMRLSYAPTDPPAGDEAAAAIYERVKQRRHPRPLLPLDLALLHAPPVADGRFFFLLVQFSISSDMGPIH